MQEGDIPIKGYPLRLPLDVLLVFTANPRDYTARGKNHHSTERSYRRRNPHPLSVHPRRGHDHHPTRSLGQPRSGRRKIEVPAYLRQVVEEIAFQAREDKRVDRRSGVSRVSPSPRSKVWSAMPSSVPLASTKKLLRASRRHLCAPYPPSPANSNSNTKAS